MKKKILILTVLVLCLGIFLCACGKKEPAVPRYKVTVTSTDDCTVQPLNETYAQGETLTLVISPASYDVIPLAKVNGKDVNLHMPIPEGTFFATTVKETKIVEYTGDWSCSITVTEELEIEVSSTSFADRVEIAGANRDAVLTTATGYVGDYYYYGEDVSSSDDSHEMDTTYGTYAVGYYRGLPYGTGIIGLGGFKTVVSETSTAMMSKYSDGRNPKEVTIHHLDTDEFVNRWIWLYSGSCADLALWAWSTVSGKVNFADSGTMTPYHGAYKVGDYEATYVGRHTVADGDGQIETDSVVYLDTIADCEKNGIQVMSEAYAQLQPGDALTWYQFGTTGHVIVVTEVNISRNRDGSISPSGSWIRYHDTHGYSTPRNEWIIVDGEMHQVMSGTKANEMMNFQDLFSKGYLPVTCRELMTGQDPMGTGAVTDSETVFNKDTVTTGIVTGNYNIDYLTMTIQKDGAVEQEAIRYWNATAYDLSNFTNLYSITGWSTFLELYDTDNVIDLSKLAGGSYRCILTVRLSNGDTVTVRDFQFTN